MKHKIIVVIAVFLLASCSVTSDEIDTATDLCKPNGGLNHMRNNLGDLVIKCNNEAYFRI